jgi:hypothetical protein
MSDLAKIKAVPDKGVFRLNLITKLLNMFLKMMYDWRYRCKLVDTTVARHAKNMIM